MRGLQPPPPPPQMECNTNDKVLAFLVADGLKLVAARAARLRPDAVRRKEEIQLVHSASTGL